MAVVAMVVWNFLHVCLRFLVILAFSNIFNPDFARFFASSSRWLHCGFTRMSLLKPKLAMTLATAPILPGVSGSTKIIVVIRRNI